MPYPRRIPFISSGPLTYAQEVLADSPVQYFKLDETSGVTAIDSSASALNGTYVNSPSLGVTAGPLVAGGTAATFTGSSSQRVERVHFAPTLNLGDVFTIEFWIKRPNSAAYTAIVDPGSSGPPEVQINNTGNTIRFLKARVAEICQSSSAIGNDVWTHVAVVKNAATSTIIYLNAVDATAAVTDSTCTNSAVGDTTTWASEGGGLYLTGSLAHAAKYATALSGARIAAHYAAR